MDLVTRHVLHYLTLHIGETFLLGLWLLGRARNFKRLGVLLLVILVHLVLIFGAVSTSFFLILSLIVHLYLVVLLLQSSAVVV